MIPSMPLVPGHDAVITPAQVKRDFQTELQAEMDKIASALKTEADRKKKVTVAFRFSESAFEKLMQEEMAGWLEDETRD